MDASPDEIAVFEIEKKIARRVEEIRLRNPGADPKKMQSLIAGSSAEIEADHQTIGKLMQKIHQAKLVRQVDGLRSQIALDGSVQQN